MMPDAPDTRPADMKPVYTGPDGYVNAIEVWKAPFSDFRWELREVFDPGESRIGARAEMVARGRASGLEIRQNQFHVWQFEHGLVRHQWVFATEDGMLTLLTHQLDS
jgi:hypothetical protein